jgi:hypothetical protein
VQAALHPPQWLASFESVTHFPPQTVCPSVHTTPPSPLAPALASPATPLVPPWPEEPAWPDAPALASLPPLPESGKLLVGTHLLVDVSHT